MAAIPLKIFSLGVYIFIQAPFPPFKSVDEIPFLETIQHFLQFRFDTFYSIKAAAFHLQIWETKQVTGG